VVSEAVRQLAAADFSAVADCFANGGFTVRLPARGILQVNAVGQANRRSVLVSVGIHGDETAPIEMLAHLLAELAAAPASLRVNLLVVVGNLDAIAAGKRQIDCDLNRLFVKARKDEGGAEGQRADTIMRATDAFFSTATGERWHLDLHTAIRASHYETFAIVPDVTGDVARAAIVGWLGSAGIQAAVLNRKLAGTYSAYSALEFGAIACTAELGRIGQLGQNDLGRFAATQAALAAMLTGAPLPARPPALVFEVAQDLIKHSAAFKLNFTEVPDNFTALEPGCLIAHDGEVEFRVGAQTEYLVFANPNGAIGKRAGLLVVPAKI
jgi:succinylglutamate desuccinylase